MKHEYTVFIDVSFDVFALVAGAIAAWFIVHMQKD